MYRGMYHSVFLLSGSIDMILKFNIAILLHSLIVCTALISEIVEFISSHHLIYGLEELKPDYPVIIDVAKLRLKL
jgi:hypothetical protein